MSKRVDNLMYNMSDILENIDEYSKYLSEGNDYLQKCLKMLWLCGYKTKASCCGHSELDKYPYIMLYTIDYDDYIKVCKFAGKLMNSIHSHLIKVTTYNMSNVYYIVFNSMEIDNRMFIALNYLLEKEYEKMEEIKFEYTGILAKGEKEGESGPYRKLPKRNTKYSGGYDFYNPERVEIEPHTIKIIKTGIKAQFPEDMVLKLYNRSSNPKKKGVMLANGVGIVDADYYGNPDNDGEIGFMFYNYTDEVSVFEAGDKLGQGIFERYYKLSNEEEITDERTGGFGSTGN